MQRDQVRRVKKSYLHTSPKRSKRSDRKTVGSPSGRTPVRPVKRASAPSTSGKNNWYIIAGIILLMLGTLWYGISHLATYLIRVPTPQFTIFISPLATPAERMSVWLLAESGNEAPRSYQLATDTELSSGFVSGQNWATVRIAVETATSAAQARTVLSQALGMPITSIEVINQEEATWSNIIGELRQQAVSALKHAAVRDEAIKRYLAALLSTHQQEPQPIAAVLTQLARQNAAAISSQENCPLAILNNSGKPGFASLVGSVIEQNGGTVIRVANALSVGESDIFNTENTMIITDAQGVQACQHTIGAVSALFPAIIFSQNEELIKQYRATMILVLGENAQLQPLTATAPNLRQ